MKRQDEPDDYSHLCRNRKVCTTVAERSRVLRQTQTAAEAIVWEWLRNHRRPVKFRRQHAISHLIVDFNCAPLRLAIEIDGGIHLRPDMRERDRYREDLLTEYGITILRLTNDEVIHTPEKARHRIQQTIDMLVNTRRSG